MYRISVAFILFSWINIVCGGSNLRFEVEPESNVVKFGSRVRLRCSTNSGMSTPRITWYFNDVMLAEDSDSSDSQNRRKRNKEDRMTLSDDPILVQSESNYGDYYWAPQSQTFFESPRNSLTRYSNPKKVRRRKEHKRKENRRKKFNTEDFTLPSTNRFARSVDQPPSIDGKRYGISIKKGRLTIANFTEQNQGSYYCTASNEDGTIRSKVAVLRKAYISNFTSSPPETFTSNHISAVIPCTMPDSLPPASPRWQINGKDWIEGTSDLYMVLTTGALLIRNVTSLGQTIYRCGAFNSITGELRMTPTTTTLVTDVQPFSQTTILYPTSTPGQVFNTTGQVHHNKLLLECISNDNSVFKWTSENEAMPESAEVSQAGLSLDVSWVRGQYNCKSQNGTIMATYNLNLIGEPVTVILGPDTFTPANDDVITMRCMVRYYTGLSDIWEWYYNGKRIADANGPELNISRSDGYSAGYYQCFASNKIGSSNKIFRVEVEQKETNAPQPVQSEEYFIAALDSDGVAKPSIDRARTPTQSTSHTLTWTTSNDHVVKLFSIKYFKEPDFVDGAVINYPWKVVNVAGDQRKVLISNLEPSSTYVVEMVAVSQSGTRSEVSMSSFGTGKDQASSTTVVTPVVPITEKPGKRGSGGKRKSDSKVPRAPSRPEVNAISAHKVSLMWNPRGNGGSPIIGYKIQRKDLEEKTQWETISKSNVYPYEVGNLQRGKTYKFRVIAYNYFGDSQASSASKPYPKRRVPQRLENPPYIMEATTQGETDIVIYWKFENVPPSSITGYYVFHRPTDSDNEDDYTKDTIKNPTVTSYVIKGLQPEMQYDIKIQAFNSLGRSPFSNVIILEMPEPGRPGGAVIIDDGLPDPVPVPDIPDTDRNDPAREKAYQRNTMFLITGAVIGVVLIVLLITVFCYWRRRGDQNAQGSPGTKHRNGNAGGYIPGKPDHINMNKLDSNGHLTPSGSNDPSQQYCHSPHDTRCHCSRHHSNHSSLGRDADYSGYPMPHGQGYPGNWSPSNYPNIHSNPMHMYMDHRHPYYPPHGLGRGMVPGVPPSWWVRGNNGEFCHIVPGDARKLNGEGGPEVIGAYTPGGHMVMRTYDGNVTTGDYDDSVHRPDNGYHSNEDGTRTSSDSQAEKSEDTTRDEDANSADAATSGVVTLNDDVTLDSRPSSPIDDVDNNVKEPDASSCVKLEIDSDTDVSERTHLQVAKSENLPKNCDIVVDENTNFLNNINNNIQNTEKIS